MHGKPCKGCGREHTMSGDFCMMCQFTFSPGHSSQHFVGWGSSVFGEEPECEARQDEKFDTDRAPDLIEPVLAWRGWDVVPTGHLTASAVQGVWDPGANKAVCKHAGHTEDVPAVNCGCGFYGWHEPDDVQHGQICGAIKCWGELIIHDVGVRAEYAEILCLFQSTTNDAWLKRAAERYDVPLVQSQVEAEALVADLGIRVPESMRPEKPQPTVDSMTQAMQQLSRALHKYEALPSPMYLQAWSSPPSERTSWWKESFS